MASTAPDLLLISDLHLGSHLKPRMRGEYVHLAASIDESLPKFLDHYLREGGRWQLVINGDFIDFWNIELGRDEALTGEALAIHRLHTALDAYPGVEDALVRVLEAGHGIVFIAGNHDAELLYRGVRRALADRLEGGALRAEAGQGHASRTGTGRLDELEPGRVTCVPWFLREEGGAWIEHGHNFDAACSTPAQLSPTRQGRLVQSLAEVATRSFSNLMPEIDYDAPDRYTLLDYARWATARGLRFAIYVILLYLRMAGRIIALWARTGRVDKAGKKAHDERMSAVAANAGLQMGALTAIEKMAPPPSSVTVGGALSVIALDLILTLLVTTTLVTVLCVQLLGAPRLLGVPVGLALGVLAARGVGKRRQKRDVHEDMARVASQVGRVTRAPLVLMGHSHRGEILINDGIVYGNSGSWLDGSHLVVRRDRATGRLAHVELRSWRNGGVVVLEEVEVPELAPEASGRARIEAAATP
ncbi:MAG: metallophosphoesterase [Nannocystaceae bacterium]|nr:metallophosphoesterase [Myxococcales bacterium]